MRCVYLVLSTAALTLISLYMAYYVTVSELPHPESLIPSSVEMTFSSGKPFYIPRSSWVDINDVPDLFKNMLLSSEDRNFFNHHGVDPKGMIRALLSNIKHRRIVQGGSTITQQLARTLYLGNVRTLKRKIKETFIAMWLEKIRTKSEILEMYVNSVYMGNGIYGFQTASLYYFGKNLKDLNTAEMASLIATLKSPEKFNPRTDIELNRKRAKYVLESALETGVLKEREYQRALKELEDLRVVSLKSSVDEEVFWRVVREVRELTGLDLEVLRNGYTIVTTLDEDLQRSVMENLGDSGACVAFDMLGRILAYKGLGVRHGSRQVGSLIKPVYYLLAILRGVRVNDLLPDLPVKIGEWKPENFEKDYRVYTSVHDALVHSRNVPSVYLFEYLSRDVVEHFMKSTLRIEGRYPRDETLALGTLETSPEQISRFFIALMNGGKILDTTIVEKILDPSGNPVYTFRPKILADVPDGVVNHYRALGILKGVLEDVIKVGTGVRSKIKGLKIYGKTGTSETNAWFAGGNDHFFLVLTLDGTGLLGGRDVAPIWRDIIEEWDPPSGVSFEFEETEGTGTLLVNDRVLDAVDYTRTASMVIDGKLDLKKLSYLVDMLGDRSSKFMDRLGEISPQVVHEILEVKEWKR